MKFIINKDELTVDDKEEIFNSGSVNYYEAEVEFDESWNRLTVKAVIVPMEYGAYEDEGKSVAVINNKIYIDKKMSGTYGIGFVGYTIEDDIKTYQISTNLQSIWFNKGAGEIETSEEDLPTPSQWEIYIAQIQEMLDNIETVPSGGTTGQVLAKKTDADGDVEWQDVQGGGGSVSIDDLTITKNSQQKLQTVAIIDNNTGSADKIWIGTKQQYDAIQNKDTNTLYYITDDDNQIIDVRVNGTSVVQNGIANITVPTNLSDLSDDTTHRLVTDTEKSTWNNKSDFSGNYDDLSNKPTIPAEVTETTVANWGFTKNTGTYSKPSGGIPKTDLESTVQTSLGKADTAVQPETGKGLFSGNYNDLTNKPTIPTVPINVSAFTNDAGYLTQHQDISGKADKVYVQTPAQTTLSINPNIYYSFGEVLNLNITLTTPTDNTIYNEYMFEFDSGTISTTLTLPNTVKWLETPTIETNKTYQCSIVNNIGVLLGV